MNPRILLTTSMLFASSFAGTAHASEADDAEAIRRTNNFYAEMLVAGDVDALMTLYDENVILFPPNESPLKGKVAIRASWEAFFADWDTMEARSVIDEIMVFGDWAYGHGHYRGHSRSTADGSVVLEALKFSGMWRRKSDGSWVIARDMFNMDAAAECPLCAQ
jgi:ketosteroid isomerase-like protein